MTVVTEHYYTGIGRQRAVFLGPVYEGGRFSLDVMEGDEASVEVSFDPVTQVRKGRGQWQRFEGGLGGSLEGFTALRVNATKLEGWVKLTVQGGMNGTAE
ncbi:MAG: hypothetical protein DI628_03070 [Blastochloris viridis]|uniref:Uncharacterized protein n=1 Tax=Blastochloris viridis TaxID=1079 RepID=A0A6N4RC91_BLAVI|nr:MAG: hypothetical protein DI628_03070 [Blastochloris viridis]